jgi:hypothetical protein
MKSVSWAKENLSENIPKPGEENASMEEIQVGHTS